MLRRLLYLLKAIVIAIAIACGTLTLTPYPANAETPVIFDRDRVIVNAATIYETVDTDENKILAEVLKSAQKLLPRSPGFIDATVLKGQDGAKVVVLSQWKDLPSYQAYESKRRDDSNRDANAKSVKIRTYAYGNIYHLETRNGIPTLHQGDKNVMFSEYLLRDPQKQSELLNITAQFMPNVMKIKTGLQWVALFPSLDKTTTAFVARFDKPEDFETLSQDAGFKESAYWDPYAENDHHLYDVVKIIS